jgi:diguanylate cyclase (GGDEF)-like protein
VLAEQALRLAQRSGKTLSVLFIDVDDLKQINDRHGHEVGSSLLNEVAEFLKESFRRTDVIGRIGGDEFAVAGVSSEAAMNIALERLERSTAERNAQHGRLHPFSFSIGHVTSEVSGSESLEELLGKADGLMYETKRRKKLLLSESKSVIKAARP